MISKHPSTRDDHRATGFWSLMRQNRTGFIGLGLTLLQFVFHGGWFAYAAFLAGNGRAQELTQDSPESWVIVVLLLLGVTTTFAAIGFSAHGMIWGRPRTPAIIGFSVSLFVGLTTALLTIVSTMTGASS